VLLLYSKFAWYFWVKHIPGKFLQKVCSLFHFKRQSKLLKIVSRFFNVAIRWLVWVKLFENIAPVAIAVHTSQTLTLFKTVFKVFTWLFADKFCQVWGHWKFDLFKFLQCLFDFWLRCQFMDLRKFILPYIRELLKVIISLHFLFGLVSNVFQKHIFFHLNEWRGLIKFHSF